MSEVLASVDAAMPRGYEKLDRIEIVKQDKGNIRFNGVIELGEGENKLERRVLLPDLVEMWGVAENKSEEDPEKIWLKKRVDELTARVAELEARLGVQPTQPTVHDPAPPAAPIEPTPVSPEVTPPRPEPEPSPVRFKWEPDKEMPVPVETDGEIQPTGWSIDTQNPDGSLNAVHKTNGQIDNRRTLNRADADRWQWQIMNDEQRRAALEESKRKEESAGQRTVVTASDGATQETAGAPTPTQNYPPATRHRNTWFRRRWNGYRNVPDDVAYIEYDPVTRRPYYRAADNEQVWVEQRRDSNGIAAVAGLGALAIALVNLGFLVHNKHDLEYLEHRAEAASPNPSIEGIPGSNADGSKIVIGGKVINLATLDKKRLGEVRTKLDRIYRYEQRANKSDARRDWKIFRASKLMHQQEMAYLQKLHREHVHDHGHEILAIHGKETTNGKPNSYFHPNKNQP
jgi:hypothetical protein